ATRSLSRSTLGPRVTMKITRGPNSHLKMHPTMIPHRFVINKTRNTKHSAHWSKDYMTSSEIFLILGTCKQILDFLCSQYMAKWLRLSASVQLVFVNYKL
ncbi:hypothetical protein Q7C36_004090, partial [Tachysurus vachellii]